MTDIYTELLIGCGRARTKNLAINADDTDWHNLITLDNNPDHDPDYIHNLNSHPLPFADNSFDEIHAYEVLEHLASQGDYKFFFAEFTEYARILKPGGYMFITVPDIKSVWALGDPSHTRVMPLHNFLFLSQDAYENQVGLTSMSDFRYIYKADFEIKGGKVEDENLIIVLQVKK